MSVSKPETRTEFKNMCLRQLGSPVITIDVTDEQIDDAIEISLNYFTDYHFDGSEKVYIKHKITSETISTLSIEISEDVIGITSVFPLGYGGGISSSDMFSPTYQYALNSLPDMSTMTLVPYYIMRLQYAQISEMLNGEFPIRFNRHTNKLLLDCDPKRLIEGQYIIVVAYTSINPETNTNVWSDRWLLKYCTSQIKRTWGANMSKFDGVQLPGGITLNGKQYYDDAIAEIEALENEMLSNYSFAPMDLVM